MRSGSAPSPCFQPYAGHPWLPELLVMSWERQFALPFRVSGEAWRPPCELGLCSFNTLHPPPLSQLPRVTAQTLPSALRGDVIQARAQAYPELPAKWGCIQSTKGEKAFQVLVIHVKRTPVAFCSMFLADRGRGRCFCDPHSNM